MGCHEGAKFGTLIERPLLYRVRQCQDWWTLARGSPWDVKVLKSDFLIVTLFSYIVWPSTMKLAQWGHRCVHFGEQKFSTTDISHTICRSATKFGSLTGLTSGHLFPEFGELWFRGPAIPCDDMHQSSTADALVLNNLSLNGAIWPNLLWSPYVIRQTIIFSCCGLFFFLLLLSFFSSPNLSGRRLDVYHTLAHGVALVRI